MLRGLYMAGTGMLTQMRRIDVTANNIANANTGGYKKDLSVSRSFDDVLIERINDSNGTPGNKSVGYLNHGIYADEVITSNEQGPIEYTGMKTDISINGNGFIVVQTPLGERLSRGGAFNINSEGNLIMGEGYQVLGQQNAIILNTEEFFIDQEGNVFADGMYVDTLRLLDVNDKNMLIKEGNLLFRHDGPQGNLEPFTGEVGQGYLEASNVDVTTELVHMMESMRNYDSNQRIIRMLDDTLAKAVNEIGRL